MYYLRRRVDNELELAFLPEVLGQLLHQQRGEAGPGASAEGVEHEEALQSAALFGQLVAPLHHHVDHFLADAVVAPGVVVRRILLPCYQLLRMVQVLVLSDPHLV